MSLSGGVYKHQRQLPPHPRRTQPRVGVANGLHVNNNIEPFVILACQQRRRASSTTKSRSSVVFRGQFGLVLGGVAAGNDAGPYVCVNAAPVGLAPAWLVERGVGVELEGRVALAAGGLWSAAAATAGVAAHAVG